MTETTDSLIGTPEEPPKIQVLVMDKQTNRTQWKQWLACVSATLSMVAVGTVFGWTTTNISRLMYDADAPVRITTDESSWIVALTVIGSMIGPFLGAWLADKFGRKRCLLMSSLFYIAGWLMVVFATNVAMLYVSRIILGVGVGMSYTTNPMYVSEVADVNIRGALGTLIAVNVFTGSLLACSIGPWVSVRFLSALLLLVPVLFVVTFVWFPESPYYLASQGRDEEALRSLAFFKGIEDKEEARRELDLVQKNIHENSEDGQHWRDKLLQLLLPNNRRALVIVIGLIVGQQLSGSFSTMQYLETLFREANIGIDSNVATIIVLAMGLISGSLATMTVEGAGRRPLLMISTLGSSVTLAILAGYLFLNGQGVDVSSVNLLPVVDVIVFQIAYQVGLGTLPNALIGELFPTNVKGIAGATITVSDGLLGFAVSKLYQVLGDSFGKHVVYFTFAGSCFVIFLFVVAFVPETKSKTFSEIQDLLRQKRIRCGKKRRDQA
ncbi:facilitated trehalose transporter Tret1 [Orussus abietinus]|uniref:facilitated trehalose transporter Tret1 n=1 Tax=Orussus abietinus TaxID=222816 RepID=UPI000626B6FA|nr:facilitated trehalose transporter Tret1 [Orussus abietinus]